jgi:hypothetical protein
MERAEKGAEKEVLILRSPLARASKDGLGRDHGLLVRRRTGIAVRLTMRDCFQSLVFRRLY